MFPSHRGRAAKLAVVLGVLTKPEAAHKLVLHPNNRVKRGLVESPELWPWSSVRPYAYQEEGMVRVNERVEDEILRDDESSIVIGPTHRTKTQVSNTARPGPPSWQLFISQDLRGVHSHSTLCR